MKRQVELVDLLLVDCMEEDFKMRTKKMRARIKKLEQALQKIGSCEGDAVAIAQAALEKD